MYSIITTALRWLLNTALLKATVFGILFTLVGMLGTFLISQISPFLSTNSLTAAFNSIPAGVWYYVDLFRIDFGLPLVISAYIARFVIRRIPVIG